MTFEFKNTTYKISYLIKNISLNTQLVNVLVIYIDIWNKTKQKTILLLLFFSLLSSFSKELWRRSKQNIPLNNISDRMFLIIITRTVSIVRGQ